MQADKGYPTESSTETIDSPSLDTRLLLHNILTFSAWEHILLPPIHKDNVKDARVGLPILRHCAQLGLSREHRDFLLLHERHAGNSSGCGEPSSSPPADRAGLLILRGTWSILRSLLSRATSTSNYKTTEVVSMDRIPDCA